MLLEHLQLDGVKFFFFFFLCFLNYQIIVSILYTHLSKNLIYFTLHFINISIFLINFFSSHIITDEPEIYGRHYTKIVIHLEKTLRIYYAHWWRNVINGATVTKWAVISKKGFCNALAVEHKCNTSLPINEACNYKREDNRS